MTSRFFLAVFVLLFTCACGNKNNETKPKAQQPVKRKTGPKQKAGLVYAYEIIKPLRNPYEDARLRIGDTLILCSYKGRIDFADTLVKSRTNITDLRCEYQIERIFILPREKERWFISWQETNQKGQFTSFAVFKQGDKKPEWVLKFPYTNLGPMVLDSNMCYFTTMGMVGKVDVNTGELQWKMDSLFNSYKWTYKRFYVPQVYPNKVVFIDLPERRRERRDTLVLDPVSGAMKKK